MGPRLPAWDFGLVWLWLWPRRCDLGNCGVTKPGYSFQLALTRAHSSTSRSGATNFSDLTDVVLSLKLRQTTCRRENFEKTFVDIFCVVDVDGYFRRYSGCLYLHVHTHGRKIVVRECSRQYISFVEKCTPWIGNAEDDPAVCAAVRSPLALTIFSSAIALHHRFSHDHLRDETRRDKKSKHPPSQSLLYTFFVIVIDIYPAHRSIPTHPIELPRVCRLLLLPSTKIHPYLCPLLPPTHAPTPSFRCNRPRRRLHPYRRNSSRRSRTITRCRCRRS